MTDGGEPSGGLVGSHNIGATSGNAWTDPFIFPMAASLRAQYSRASSMFIFKISDGLASMNALVSCCGVVPCYDVVQCVVPCGETTLGPSHHRC